jgi:hypothetical protein
MHDVDITCQSRLETTCITVFCGRFLVVSFIGNHVQLLAICQRFDGKAIVSLVTVISDHDYAANGGRFLEIDLPPCFVGVLLNVGDPIAVSARRLLHSLHEYCTQSYKL